MANINLLPPDIRKDAEKRLLAFRSGIPLEVAVGSIGGVLFVIVFLHLILMSLSIQRLASYKILENQWKALEVRRVFIDSITKELGDLKAEQEGIETLFSRTFRQWAQTLNFLSLNLPKGIWFNKMTVGNEEFVLEGSAVARDTDEIVSVHSYVNKLRSDNLLKAKFSDFILDSVQKRRMPKIDAADFTIKSKIHSIGEEKQLAQIMSMLSSDPSADAQQLYFAEPLPGVPEDAKANMRVTDKKPLTGVSR